MLFLLILAGAYDINPLNKIFFLEADTSRIPNAENGISHWTLYNLCGSNSGLNYQCRKPNQAAYPFDPVRNFGTTDNIPQDFIDHQHTYYYLSRFLYAFLIISVVFAVMAWFLAVLAIIIPMQFAVASAALFSAIAWFCVAFSACVMTACYVKAQNAFHNDDRFARVGVKAFAFAWTSFVLLGLSTILLTMAAIAIRRHHNHPTRSRRRGEKDQGRNDLRNSYQSTGTTADSQRVILQHHPYAGAAN
jgi:hypothetical protein